MQEQNIQAVILAGGRSTRFGTGRTKLLEKICGQEMILYPTTLLAQLELPITVLVGYQAAEVKECITKKHGNAVTFALQEEQKGTGHALLCTKELWHKEFILVMNGDIPLITAATIEQLLQKQRETNAVITFATAHNSDPSLTGYGRVIQEGHHISIIEPKEFHGNTNEHCCINAGMYLIKKDFLIATITELQQNPQTQEFFLTDIIKIACDKEKVVKTVTVPFDAVRGVNDFKELWTAEQIKRSELITKWMIQGVRFHAAQNVHIDLNVTIGAGSYLGNGVHVINNASIGTNCTIEAFSIINNSHIANDVKIYSHSVINDSTIAERCLIGPFAHIEGNSTINTSSVIGNFVQVKKSNIGTSTKAKHLSFLGNATIGNAVNIGAGTITCNYDGINKHVTTIEDNTFIGSNNTLVAPLTIEKNSYTAAGSTITKQVPAGTLAIGRAYQVNKEGYAQKMQKKHNDTNNDEQSFLAATRAKNNTPNIQGI